MNGETLSNKHRAELQEESAKTPYPLHGSRRAYDLEIQSIPLADLRAEIEAAQWLALDLAGESRDVAEIQLEGLVDELERRKRLWTAKAGDPLRPAWPRRDDDLKARIEAVKAAWPIERFCIDLLGVHLQRSGRNRWKAECPLPGHDDRSPSFVVYGESDSTWCFGCNRGGDIFKLTGYVLGLDHFYDRLEHLEAASGTGNRGVA